MRNVRKRANPSPPLDVKVVNDAQVSVINSSRSPLPVVDVQNPAFNPMQVDVRFTLGRGAGAGEAVFPLEGNEGRRVVIEHVTVAAELPEGQGVRAYIKIGEIKHALVLTPQEGWERPCLRASQPIKLYSLAGGIGFALAGVERTSTRGSASFYFTVSGYLVDLP